VRIAHSSACSPPSGIALRSHLQILGDEVVHGGCAPSADVSFLDSLIIVAQAAVADACFTSADVRTTLVAKMVAATAGRIGRS
jgi:hypothetical protein